jgi:uncharacterized protein with NRDE domain
MCTMTWVTNEGGFWLGFNRDEQKSRPAAFPPSPQQWGAHLVLSAIDPVGGGTWLATGAFGALALVNDYESAPPKRTLTSRGQVIVELLRSTGHLTLSSLNEFFSRQSLQDFAGFRLHWLSSSGGHVWHWNAQSLVGEQLTAPFMAASSSFEPQKVVTHRRQAWERWIATSGTSAKSLTQFHHSAPAPGGAWAIQCQREDARTVSFSAIQWSADGCHWRYEDLGNDRTPTTMDQELRF